MDIQQLKRVLDNEKKQDANRKKKQELQAKIEEARVMGNPNKERKVNILRPVKDKIPNVFFK